jgi:anti-anti-sigma regulatory factor
MAGKSRSDHRRLIVMEPPTAVARSQVLKICGDVGGANIGVFCDTLTAVVNRRHERVLMDLSGLRSWSLVAQAMVLRAARRLRAGGGQLILVAPRAELVDRSIGMDVFGSVTTVGAARSSYSRLDLSRAVAQGLRQETTWASGTTRGERSARARSVRTVDRPTPRRFDIELLSGASGEADAAADHRARGAGHVRGGP